MPITIYVQIHTYTVLAVEIVILNLDCSIPRDLLVDAHSEKHSSNPIVAKENKPYKNTVANITLSLDTYAYINNLKLVAIATSGAGYSYSL